MKISSSFLYFSLLFTSGLLIGSIIASGLNGGLTFCIGLYVMITVKILFTLMDKSKARKKRINLNDTSIQWSIKRIWEEFDELKNKNNLM